MASRSKRVRAIVDTIDRAYFGLERLSRKATRGWRTPYCEQAFKAALVGEKEHTRFGASMLGHKPTQLTAPQARARYFACKWALEAAEAPKDWTAACEIRDDARLSYACRDELESVRERNPELHTAWRVWVDGYRPLFEAIDYARDLSGGGHHE